MKNSKRQQIAELLIELYTRWQDEQEYECFSEYEDTLKKAVSKTNMTFVQMTKKPFGFTWHRKDKQLMKTTVIELEYDAFAIDTIAVGRN